MCENMEAKVKRTDEEKLEYVNFILLVGRMDVSMYWQHLDLLDGTVLIHSMSRSNKPGYSNFRVRFQQHWGSTGYHCIRTCSAEELYEDRRLAHVYLPLFRQLFRTLRRKYNFRFFTLIANLLFPGVDTDTSV